MLSLGPLAAGAPWGLLGLLAVPTILAIHLFRRRSPPRRVTGLFLWPQPAPTAASGRRRERIVNQASLWLELLAALALTWWLADLHPAGDDQGRHLVLVVDSRLSLGATLPAGDTPAARIRSSLNARLAGLTRHDRMSLVASGAVPRLLAGPATDATTVTTALAAWQPTAGWHDLAPAVALASQLAAGHGEVVVASDRVPTGLPTGIGVIARGEAVPTSGLADARWLRDASGERLAVRLTGTAAVRPLTIRTGTQVLPTGTPQPGASTVIIPLTNPPDSLELTLVGPDPLPFDDTAILHRPPQRSVRVTVTLPEAAKRAVERVLQALPDVIPGGTAPQLILSDGAPPEPGCWHLRLGTGASEQAALGPFLIRRGHPLAQDLDGTGLLWVGGRRDSAVDLSPLISAGDLVLYGERRRGRDRLLELNADLSRGTLVQHPLWPALLANLIEARRAALPGCVSPDVLCQRPVAVVLPPGHDAAGLQAPDGTSATLSADADGVVLVPPLTQPGTWQLSLDGKPWENLHALPLDPRLGDLHAATTTDQAADDAGLTAVARRRSPSELLLPLLIAAGAAIGAWLCAQRGR